MLLLHLQEDYFYVLIVVRPSGSKMTMTSLSVGGLVTVGPEVTGEANPGPEGTPTHRT